MKCIATLACCIAGANAFMPIAPGTFVARSAPVAASSSSAMRMSAFDTAQAEFASEFGFFSKLGMGPTTKAERWNGRHVMAGWIAIILTGYAKGHGLIPNGDALLDVKQWGTLATIAGPQSISNERAVILIAHVHMLIVSIMATAAPLSFQDTLLLKDGEKDEPAAGLIPAFVPGLTKEAELLNGRLAMLGLVLVAGHAIATGTSFLDSTNLFLGGLLY